jgi:hypothetical protein
MRETLSPDAARKRIGGAAVKNGLDADREKAKGP